MKNWNPMLLSMMQPIMAILFGLTAGAIVVSFTGESVMECFKELWRGAFGSFYFLSSTMARATPIILSGLGIAFAFRAGFFNMGAEGQMVLGGLAAALTALHVPGPGWVKLVAALCAGIAAGGMWSVLAVWMEVKFKVNLLISTLLLNYIAVLFAGYIVSGPFKDTSGSAGLAQTAMIDQGSWLPKLYNGMSVHAGFSIAIGLTVLFVLMFRYSIVGYEVKMLGLNPSFAMYGGVNRLQMMIFSMVASGGLAGLAGGVEVLGMQYRFVDGALTMPGYAWTALMAALLANAHPAGTAVCSFLLAALQTGAAGMERNTNVPVELSAVIQAVLILFVSVKFGYSFMRRRKARKNNGSII
ncbi:ABC transporter permease [Paenibacillus beijingensis]|uniref:ABC transporter permease n=1 Tax=Paenibacillus beijingensis TaxID=1126833 RepID=A0A0D5NKG6_9BACL|nr:ABC transporter permease [Paenibacillus beijingensis]AJY75428.1 ABC transporter permease [Paenibacillus beijingensis]